MFWKFAGLSLVVIAVLLNAGCSIARAGVLMVAASDPALEPERGRRIVVEVQPFFSLDSPRFHAYFEALGTAKDVMDAYRARLAKADWTELDAKESNIYFERVRELSLGNKPWQLSRESMKVEFSEHQDGEGKAVTYVKIIQSPEYPWDAVSNKARLMLDTGVGFLFFPLVPFW